MLLGDFWIMGLFRRKRYIFALTTLAEPIRARFGFAVDSFCVSGLGAATTARADSRENSVTLTREETTSESGLGPAWIRPSWRIETSENGEAAARSSKAWSFGCRPSPRDAAKTLN